MEKIMKTVKMSVLLAVLVVLNLGQTIYPVKNAASDDIVSGTIWSRKFNGEVSDDYAFSKGLYVYTTYVYDRELPGEYRVKGNLVEMHDMLTDTMSVGKIDGDKMTVRSLDDKGKEYGDRRVYTKDK